MTDTPSSKDKRAHHLKQYKNTKDQPDFNLITFIQNQPTADLQNIAATTMALCLLRALATPDPSLQNTVNADRQGRRSLIEGMLRQIIEMDGISVDPDVLYGKAVSLDVRIRWQELGMDPDSEDEVFAFLERNDIDFLFTLDNNALEKMQTHANDIDLFESNPDMDKDKKPNPK